MAKGGIGRTAGRSLEEGLHPVRQVFVRDTIGEVNPLYLTEFFRHPGGHVRRVINRNRQKKGLLLGHVVRAINRQFPFPPEIALQSRVGVARNHRNKERTILDLAADFGVPRVATHQFAPIKPHLNPMIPQRFGNRLGRGGILAGIAEENGLE